MRQRQKRQRWQARRRLMRLLCRTDKGVNEYFRRLVDGGSVKF